MQPTNNLRVLNAHTSHSASPIQLSCLQCDRTFLSTWGRKRHLRTIHPLSTTNYQPSPPPPSSNPHSQAGLHPRSPNLFVDVPSPSSPSPSNMPSSSSSHVSSSTHPVNVTLPVHLALETIASQLKISLMMKAVMVSTHLKDPLAHITHTTITLGGNPFGAQVQDAKLQVSIVSSPRSNELIIPT